MAVSSSRSWIYDVFPSFRGEDVRHNFLSHLLDKFKIKGILSFIDDNIERGETIGPELIKAIRESKISVVLFSENYASSSWCLEEMVEILKCKKEHGLTVMPIFYNVNPSDVRRQTGNFGMGFLQTCCGKTEEQRRSWKQALIEAANIVGYHLQDWDSEADMITTISIDVLKTLNETPSRDFDDFVGIEAHIAKMKSLLCLESQEVRIVGIWGPAGIGKTTIARVLYNQYYENFEFYLFIENVGESYGKTNLDDYGLKLRLQKKFLSELFDQKGLKINRLDAIEKRLKSKRVLIVLDNVDNIEQLKALAETQWFGDKSRIIVTTQNKQVLVSHDINHYLYEVPFPSKQEALTIFCQHAFKQNSPPDDLKNLAIEFATLAGHLPLGLSVLGSFMRGKSKEEWEFSLPSLKTRIINGKIEKVLKVGYDSLDKDAKSLFLHIACFFNGHQEHFLKQMVVTNNDLDISFGLKNMADKCLVHIYENGRIEMHSLLQQLGREVVRDQSIYEPGKRQFLMNAREICGVLSNNTGTNIVLGISLNMCDIKEKLYIDDKTFEEMRNLLYLKIYRSNHEDNKMMAKLELTEEGLSYLPQLRLLQWDAYPHNFFPSRFRPECLVELSMTNSKLKKLWTDVQPLTSIRYMNLSDSQHLEIIPNLLKATNLMTLNLSWCESLVELPSSIKNLHKLTLLEMSFCKRLEIIPTNINLASLTHLHFRGCSRLTTFPEISTSLIYLKIKGTKITEVPSSVRYWHRIKEICMESTNVKTLAHVPYALDGFCLRGNIELKTFPEYLEYLHRLRYIDVSYCINLISLPRLPDSLSAVIAVNCESLQILHGPFRNKNIALNFTNCLKLDQDARKQINMSVIRVTLFPGEHVPGYFPYWDNGRYIRIYSDMIDLTKFSTCKVCLVLKAGKSFKHCSVYFYRNISPDKEENYYPERRIRDPQDRLMSSVYQSFQPKLERDHLCMFEFALWQPENDVLTEVEVQRPFQTSMFSFVCDGCEVKEWGIDFLESSEKFLGIESLIQPETKEKSSDEEDDEERRISNNEEEKRKRIEESQRQRGRSKVNTKRKKLGLCCF